MKREKKELKGKVFKITKNYFELCSKEGKLGIVFINDISDFFVADINDYVKIGDNISVEILHDAPEHKAVKCSFKNLRPEHLKSPFEFRMEDVSDGATFSRLKNFVEDEVKRKWKR